MNQNKPWTVRALRATAYALLCFATLETSARIDDIIKWDAPFRGTYSKETLFVVDSVGYHNQPNAEFEKWKINSFGFRGEEIERQAPEDVTRILLLGSSETFGLYESPGKEFPAQIGEKLNDEYPGRFQVLNGGVPGINIPLVQHLYENWLAGFKPDLVLYTPWPTAYLLNPPPGQHNIDNLEKIRSAPFELRIVGKTKTMLKGFVPASLQTAISDMSNRKLKAGNKDQELLMDVPMDRLDLFAEHLTGFIHLIQQNGARVVLLTRAVGVTPPFSEHEQRWLVDWHRRYPLVADDTLLEMVRLGNRTVKEVARQTGVEVIDVASQIPKTTEFFADHVHFTSVGSEKMAAIIAQGLSAHYPPLDLPQ
jgi:hypothetical protein